MPNTQCPVMMSDHYIFVPGNCARVLWVIVVIPGNHAKYAQLTLVNAVPGKYAWLTYSCLVIVHVCNGLLTTTYCIRAW